ncbi:MAG: 4-hydroxythreonine-4-phosphate dehydrogenase PdxA [Methylocystis sp.]|nr:4-hydroxythreonine-4-phosphate dehydrogenase PdxA [Methylocystis sp.]MBI3275926.1 4-hydroxythreonine-4-phosphate dehydrogenase PdxA [Methylocystis sp.]
MNDDSALVPPLALTQGDPSGIGPELALKAWAARIEREAPPFFVLGDPAHLARVAKALGADIPIATVRPCEANDVFSRALPVAPLGIAVRGVPGAPDPADAPATILSIERAVASVAKGEARALVTNPIAKRVLYAAGFNHPGHTEFLAALAKRYYGCDRRSVMMLWAEELAVVPLTIHVALRDVPRLLTRQLLVETALIVVADLARRLGVENPRLAFAGLNPHAGEGGAMGREEIDVIAPAIAELRARGVDASGPYPADSLFHGAARARYDAALCPTHDQALIPIKTLAFQRAVNVTLGLPFVRTSPDHGAAFDIAGKGVADATSLIEAIRLAARMTEREGA